MILRKASTHANDCGSSHLQNEPKKTPSRTHLHADQLGSRYFETKRTGRDYLRDIFAGPRPMKAPAFARQNDDAARRIGLSLVAIELFAATPWRTRRTSPCRFHLPDACPASASCLRALSRE